MTKKQKQKKKKKKRKVLAYRLANLHYVYILGRLDATVLQWSVVLFESWEILVKVC
jgi:glycopeptide antibiotics resistance protein